MKYWERKKQHGMLQERVCGYITFLVKEKTVAEKIEASSGDLQFTFEHFYKFLSS